MEPITHEIARALLPARPDAGHKGTFGHVFILAGSRGFTGAAKLACRAAERSGVGLVTLGIPAPLLDVVASELSETMCLPLPAADSSCFAPEAATPALAFAREKQAVVLGPGLSRRVATREFVLTFVHECKPPMVLDADGLNTLAESSRVRHAAPLIMTPHPGEMARLLACSIDAVQSDRPAAAMQLAKSWNAVVVLKGQGTLVAAPDGRIAQNTTGNNGLGKGGTGDALSGLVGGLLAQGMDAFDAARLGVYAHGLAGDLAAREKTARGMIASDAIEALPAAWRVLEGQSA